MFVLFIYGIMIVPIQFLVDSSDPNSVLAVRGIGTNAATLSITIIIFALTQDRAPQVMFSNRTSCVSVCVCVRLCACLASGYVSLDRRLILFCRFFVRCWPSRLHP